jgi:putative DNA primase/helicase
MNYFDFNDAHEAVARANHVDFDSIRQHLLDRLETIISNLFPQAVLRGGQACLGNIEGKRGDSLTISLTGTKRGQWFDFATNEGGDHVELFARGHSLSARSDFRQVMERAAQWLGTALPIQNAITALATVRSNQSSESTAINLGAPTAKWDYLDASGALIACVYRFDPAPGKKQFRPWNVSTRSLKGLIQGRCTTSLV